MQTLIDYLAHLPVEWFVLIGATIQEVVSPLPSFVIFVPGGASLAAHHAPLIDVIAISLLAAVGRVIAALLLYWLSGSLRTHIYTNRRRWLGIDRHDIKRLEKQLHGKGSWWAIFGLWAVPVVPGALISLSGGFVRVPLVIFTSATYAGAVVSALAYLLVGYAGLATVVASSGIETEFALAGIFCLILGGAIIYNVRKKKS